MSLIRTAAATALGVYLAGRVQLAEPPVVLNAPPSERAKYPALAILLDKTEFEMDAWEDVEVNPNVAPGQPGYVLEGTYRTDASDNYVDGPSYIATNGNVVSHVGTLHCTGRIWVGARSAPQREKIENDVWLAFFQDDARPGIIQLSIAGVNLGPVQIPFGIATTEIFGSEWTAEQAFTERLWSYLTFYLDAPILVPLEKPVAKTLTLAISQDLTAAIAQPTDLSLTKLPDLEEFTVDTDGNATETL